MLKILSIFGYVGMIGGLLGLLVAQHLFSSSALVISLQVVAVLLLVWARVTFGRRSFHVVADPTEGGLVTKTAVCRTRRWYRATIPIRIRLITLP